MRLLEKIKSVEGDKSECLTKDNSNKNLVETFDNGKSVQERKQPVKKTQEVSKKDQARYYNTKPQELDQSRKNFEKEEKEHMQGNEEFEKGNRLNSATEIRQDVKNGTSLKENEKSMSLWDMIAENVKDHPNLTDYIKQVKTRQPQEEQKQTEVISPPKNKQSLTSMIKSDMKDNSSSKKRPKENCSKFH